MDNFKDINCRIVNIHGHISCQTGVRVSIFRVALDIANPIDPIDLSIRILNQVVAMECDEALRRPRWCGRSKSRDLL